MKKTIFTLAILLTGTFSTALVTSCGSKQAETEQSASDADSTHQHGSDTTQVAFACPMHPEITGKEGDKCSQCGMLLEKKGDANEEKN